MLLWIRKYGFIYSSGEWSEVNTQAYAIVLIEKDEVTLELYQRELSKSFTVYAFHELNDVLDTIANQDIQAIVIEPEIGYGKGWELIHSVHEAFPNRFIPVIVCSTRDIRASSPIGEVVMYLTKPVLPKTLKKKILEVLKNKTEYNKHHD